MDTRTTSSASLCLLTVHAHPDDEASKGSGTVAKYSAEAVRTVLVCCTGGEAGEVLNKKMDLPGVLERLPAIRMEELKASAAILGYTAMHLLGYHDSGMPDTEWNHRPDNFANAPLEEATERLVKIIRAERPQVIVTYPEDRQFYAHPDHIRVYEVSVAAFDAAGDGRRFPEAGEPWQPLKLYYTGGMMSRERLEALEPVFEAHGLENPFVRWRERWKERGMPEERRATTRIDVGEYLPQRRASLLAHQTQIDPDGHWLRLPDEALRTAYPFEEFELVRSLIENQVSEGELETDLFAGLR
ncbi:MAG: mycothiol conjugate amidase Mca [Chloroflexota bacterium]|nr:mycothiol conjugate amidase Mca [Chloroflexota bacterium]